MYRGFKLMEPYNPTVGYGTAITWLNQKKGCIMELAIMYRRLRNSLPIIILVRTLEFIDGKSESTRS